MTGTTRRPTGTPTTGTRRRKRPVLPREGRPRGPIEYLALMGTTAKVALEGIAHTVRHQRNMRNYAAAAVLITCAGLWLGLPPLEWAVLAIAFAVVFAAELMNSAIEATVDLVTQEWHELAKVAKDAAAGAVLISAAGALAASLLIIGARVLS